ncbi:hypothetical protein FRC10_004689 [Ceratobasidium sp. 414]|nr:hypothetical protein FRC10_004689 [Ceratobasidium sp. 414]
MVEFKRGIGLVRGVILRADRCDGGPAEYAPVQNLHVITHQGTYKGAPVEIKELVERNQAFDK